jgi:nucleoid DNA-binding protein
MSVIKKNINDVVKLLTKKINDNDSIKTSKNNLKINERNVKIIIKLFNRTLCELLKTKQPVNINIRGFLQINKKWQEERINTDPRNPDKKIKSSAKYIVRLKAGLSLKNSAN